MQYEFTRILSRLALAAACVAVFPLQAVAAPTVQFLVPVEGGAMWGNVQGPPNCIVTGSDIAKVAFYLNGVWTNSDGNASNGFGCWMDTTKYQDGTYTLKAVAYNAAGQTATATRSIVIQNADAPKTSGSNPAIAFQAPAVGGALSGNVQGPPHCVVTGYNIAKVMFYLNGAWTNTDGNLLNGLGCWIDTTKYVDGDYTVKAVAYNSSGSSASIQRAVRISNGLGLPSAGTKAIPTFESIGLYWTPPANPGAAGCDLRYRKAGETAWKAGLPMWYDARNSECRGSLVQLAPDTTYEVQFALPGQQPVAELTARTWTENFAIAKVVQLSGTRTSPLNITQGGTANGYVLYTGPATIDVANAYDHNITISAPYVIVRGLTLKGARIHGIRMLEGARDVVIEDNDISGWGRDSGKVSVEGYKIGVNTDSGIYAQCGATPWLERSIIQRNRIHHPRYGSNSWSEGHPTGPNAAFFGNCGGNHVFRHNEIYSDYGRYFMDGYGGEDNFSNAGMPNADSDIYGNLIMQVWDDAIEAEGANRNVRIWGNYTDQTAVAIATSATHAGPVYIFRNVMNRSRQLALKAPDDDEELGRAFAKSGSTTSFGGGRRYVLHNTLLQAPPPSGSLYESGAGIGLKGNGGQPMTNTVSRNNIYQIRKSWLAAIDERGAGTGNDLDYDLFNGSVISYPGAEANGIVGTPMYETGHGWSSEWGGLYQLAPWSPGYDRGVYLPNFNDGFTGSAPDIGAHEAGTPAMRFGVGGSSLAY